MGNEITVDEIKEIFSDIVILYKLGTGRQFANRHEGEVVMDQFIAICHKNDKNDVLTASDFMKASNPYELLNFEIWRKRIAFYRDERTRIEKPETRQYTSRDVHVAKTAEIFADFHRSGKSRQELIDEGIVTDPVLKKMWKNPRYPMNKPPGEYDEIAYKKWLKEESNYPWAG